MVSEERLKELLDMPIGERGFYRDTKDRDEALRELLALRAEVGRLRGALENIQEITDFESSNPEHLLELIFEKAGAALSHITASGEAGKE